MKNNFLSGRKGKNFGKWKNLEYSYLFHSNTPYFDIRYCNPPFVRYRVLKNKKRHQKWLKEVDERINRGKEG